MNIPTRIYFLLLFALCVFLAFNRHSKSTYGDYHSVIWSDKAGYYMYLPSIFISNLNTHDFDKTIISSTGNGFKIEDEKFKTKYFIGVAILQLPFFLLTLLICQVLSIPLNFGYSPPFHFAIMLSSVCYALIGLILSFKLLQNLRVKRYPILLVTAIFGGTNLYYFVIDQSGMSHGYSFFLFSVYLYYLNSFFIEKKKYKLNILIVVYALICLVRPTNCLIVFMVPFFLGLHNESLKTFLSEFSLKKIFLGLFFSILLITPQIIYWKYLTNSFFIYPYVGEGFTKLFEPEILKTLFSPKNGWLIHNPIAILAIVALCSLTIRKGTRYFSWVLFLLVLITYVFASWWQWHFGCSFGHRGYIEYYAILIIPLSIWFNGLKKKKRIFFTCLMLLLCILNLKMTYSIDNCWYYGDWDYNKYLEILSGPTL